MSERVRVEKGVYRRSDGRFVVGFRDGSGKQRWRAVDGGIKSARAALAREHAKRASGERLPENVRLTFEAAADAWLESRVGLRPGSLHVYRNALGHLKERFGRTRLVAIGPDEVASYLRDAERAGAAPESLRKRLDVLGQVLDFATRRLGHPGANPVRALDRSERPRARRTSRRALTDEQVAALLDAVAEPHRDIFALLAETGLRASEAAGLAWEDVDLDRMELSVRRQLSRSGAERVEPKTPNSERTIAITSDLTRRLRERYLASGRPDGPELVFRRPSGQAYGKTSLYAAMKPARRVPGLEDVHPHLLRHAHASALVGTGWDVVEVAARLGDTVATTMRVYAHEFDAVRRRADQRDRLEALGYGSAGGAHGSERGRTTTTNEAANPPKVRAIGERGRAAAT